MKIALGILEALVRVQSRKMLNASGIAQLRYPLNLQSINLYAIMKDEIRGIKVAGTKIIENDLYII